MELLKEKAALSDGIKATLADLTSAKSVHQQLGKKRKTLAQELQGQLEMDPDMVHTELAEWIDELKKISAGMVKLALKDLPKQAGGVPAVPGGER